MSSNKTNKLKSWEKELSQIGALATLALDDCEKSKQANIQVEERLKEIGQVIESLYMDLECASDTRKATSKSIDFK